MTSNKVNTLPIIFHTKFEWDQEPAVNMCTATSKTCSDMTGTWDGCSSDFYCVARQNKWFHLAWFCLSLTCFSLFCCCCSVTYVPYCWAPHCGCSLSNILYDYRYNWFIFLNQMLPAASSQSQHWNHPVCFVSASVTSHRVKNHTSHHVRSNCCSSATT